MQPYTDKEILNDALIAEKASTTTYNTCSNECVHENVRDTILRCLEQEHSIQYEVFNMMHSKGYYPTPAADMKKVEETKQKYAQCVKHI